MTKITVIDVNLGDIDDIVKRNVLKLGAETKEIIDQAVQEQRQTTEAKITVKNLALAHEQAIITAVEAAFKLLLSESEKGRTVAANRLLVAAMPAIPNLISFVNRMRNYLRQCGNDYRLVNSRVRGEQHYALVPFNKTDD